MTVEDHADAITTAQKSFNDAIMSAMRSGLSIKTNLSGDSASIYSVEITLLARRKP